MNVEKSLTAIGTGITTFLLVAVLVIEGLDIEFSAIIGLPVGLVTGVAVLVALWYRWDRLAPGIRRAASACAAFGLTMLALLALTYVNVGRETLTVDVVVGIALAAAVAVYAVRWLSDRETGQT